ncbi:hypothetical protein [Paenibacillus sp. GP183]|uniref:hypothetical protein n=1 Tax=Paenibacillus sp. GP183 TaxID=1882751 RepID=UPI00089573FE|nr:hypothetical protein [Paenibacillus sp. GP183]SEC40315.1 hypothetical protein SAMN05443246_3980 [Paenibacillus sp. GP183]
MLGKIHPHYYLGALIGVVIGYVISKIYQIWAIVYRESHFDLHMQNSWNAKNPPLWITATENPEVFSFWVVFIFIIVGVIFVRILKTKKN